MISSRLTNCKGCADIPDLLRRIDCKLAELGNNLYNNVVFMLNKPTDQEAISQLLVYKRVLTFRYCDTHYARYCNKVTTEDIASKVIRLTAGCVPHCGEPTVCEITTCPITPVPNPTTTTTSTSSTSTSTTTTTSTSSTTTTTTTLNCNFSGSIDCNITTTTTTTPAPTTSTTTTYFPDPFGVPCLWSTNGGDLGLLAVYDFDTNTATDVLVPNDFNDAPALNRPLCATEDKLWLVSAVDQGSNPDNDFDDQVYIREWDIDATGVAPTLTYVREITLESGQFPGSFNAGSSVWAITAIDNNTLIVGVGNDHTAPVGTGGSGQRYAYEFSISTPGDITITDNDLLGSKLLGATSNDYYGKLSNLTYTNSGQLIVGWYNILRVAPFDVTNYIGVFNGTPSDPDFGLNNQAIPTINLQEDVNFPEFEPAYTGPWDIPFWGVNGLAQILNPENGVVYTIDQSPLYELTFTTLVSSDDDWLSSATHCSNITFNIADTPECIENSTYLPPFFFDSEGNPAGIQNGGVYDPTPQQFQFAGMTCTASISENVNAFDDVRQSTDQGLLGCSGLVEPASSVPFTRAVSGYNFNITIQFPQAMNDLSIRAAILNSNSDLTSGDVYYVETNGGTPTLSITQGCKVQVIGNRFGGGIDNNGQPSDVIYWGNDSGGEFKVTAPNDYTSLTIYGNAPTGGPLFLGCPPPNCKNMVYIQQGAESCSDPESAGRCVSPPDVPMEQYTYSQILVWNKDTDVCTEVGPPPGTGFMSGDVSIGDNIVVTSSNFRLTPSTSDQCFIKYDCTVTDGVPSNLQWDGKKYVLPPFWDDFNGDVFIPNLEVINDNQIGVTVSKFSVGAPCWYDVRFLICTFPEIGEEMIVEEKFQFACASTNTGDIVVTYKPDGVTPNKLIALQGVEVVVEDGVLVNKLAVTQYDIATGALEVVTKAEDFIDPSGIGAALAIVDGELYAGSAWWAKIDWNYPYAWTLLGTSNPQAPCPAGGAGTVPACRITDGFTPSPVSTTTTTTDPNTTTTTTTVPGLRTIFTKFDPITNP